MEVLMSNNIIMDKSFDFALRIVKLYQNITLNKKEFIMSKQLLRAGTSIGANVRESRCAVSTADFKNKLSIALKEAKETEYWIQLLIGANYLTREETDNLEESCNELCKILGSIIVNCKN